jgi:hemerythrin-like domain-containing protein
MGWRKILEAEHVVLLEVVDAAEREARHMEETGESRPEVIRSMLDFFRYFNDGLHDPKEEGLLFSRCHRRGMPCDEGKLGRMMHEHEVCRTHIDGLRDGFAKLNAGTMEPQDFARRLYGYAELLREHIEIEQNEFYDAAQQYLTLDDRKELSEEFESVHYDEVEEGVLEYYEELGHHLSAQ